MGEMPAMEIVRVHKQFGSFVALDGVSLSVEPGTLHAIIGPNGAGKTTLFNVLTGQLRPTAGKVLVHGRDVTNLPVHARVGAGLGRSFQLTNIFRELTVLENVRLSAGGVRSRSAYSFWSRASTAGSDIDGAHLSLERVGLAPNAARLASELSHGQQRLLELAMALAAQPDVLLLDEPTSGMGTDDIPLMEKLLGELTGNYTVVMIEHNMAMTMRVADKIAVLVAGRVLVDASPDLVRANPEVQRAYLGQVSDADS